MSHTSMTKIAGRATIAGFLFFLFTEFAHAAAKAAKDPVMGPVTHAVSLTATALVWSNWITAILGVPLALLCAAYYIAVLYESKLFANIVAWWMVKRAGKNADTVVVKRDVAAPPDQGIVK